MEAMYWWIIIGILFLIIEISIPGLFFFISLAIGCGAGGISTLLGISINIQYVIALISALISLYILTTLFANKKHQKYASNSDALVGQKAIVTHTLESHTPGRVKVNGEEWPAITQNHTRLEKNTLVTIIKIEGNKLIVKSH